MANRRASATLKVNAVVVADRPYSVSANPHVAANWYVDMLGAEFAVEPWEFRPGARLCYLAAPDGVSVEIVQRLT